MPELPEVETIKRGLRPLLKDRQILEVKVSWPGKLRLGGAPCSGPSFIEALSGKRIVDLSRRGKFLIFSLSHGYLLIHLGMTGQLIWGRCLAQAMVAFRLGKEEWLNFLDQRKFGGIFYTDELSRVSLFRAMGPEPLEDSLSPERFYGRLEKRRVKIKPLLMDQGFLAGVGNIYAAEALFRAGIHPSREAGSLSREEAARLLSSLRKILQEAIALRGTSIRNYRDHRAEPGRFASSLAVYGRSGQRCLRCKGTIMRIELAGRGTYLCPGCQV